MQHAPIVLFGAGAGFGLPDKSPFVHKAETQLKMAGIPYEKRTGSREEAPKGKFPYIEDAGTRMGDSTLIRAYLERRDGIDLDAGLSAQQRAQAWTLERLLEDHLYWALIYYRWMDLDNFAKGPAHNVDHAPEALRPQLRADMQARVAETLRMHGLGRHAPEEILDLGRRSLDATAAWLGDRDYLFGDRPSAADATASAMLAGVLTPFFESPLREAAEGHANLVAHAARMMARYFPEHPWHA
jgi:glutathione S-transferase